MAFAWKRFICVMYFFSVRTTLDSSRSSSLVILLMTYSQLFFSTMAWAESMKVCKFSMKSGGRSL